MNRSLLLSALVVVAAVTGVTGLAATPAAAQSGSDGPLSGVLETNSSDGLVSWSNINAVRVGAFAAGDRALWAIQQKIPDSERLEGILGSEDPTAAREAESVTAFYNANNQTIEVWANQRSNFSSNETVEVKIHLNGKPATRYLVTTASNGIVTNSTMVVSTPRNVTETLVICGYAAAQAYEEISRFVENFAEPNEDVTKAYLARIKGRYGGDVETSLIQSSGDCGGTA